MYIYTPPFFNQIWYQFQDLYALFDTLCVKIHKEEVILNFLDIYEKKLIRDFHLS